MVKHDLVRIYVDLWKSESTCGQDAAWALGFVAADCEIRDLVLTHTDFLDFLGQLKKDDTLDTQKRTAPTLLVFYEGKDQPAFEQAVFAVSDRGLIKQLVCLLASKDNDPDVLLPGQFQKLLAMGLMTRSNMFMVEQKCIELMCGLLDFVNQLIISMIIRGLLNLMQFAKRSGETSKYATQVEQLGGRSKAEAAMRNFGSLDCGPRLINYLEGDSPRSDYSPVLDIFPSLGIFDNSESDLSD